MEKEFVKLAKQLLNEGIFQQMEDSRQPHVHVRGTKGLPYIHPREPNDKLSVPKPNMGTFSDTRERNSLILQADLKTQSERPAVHITAKFKSDRQNAEMTAETAFFPNGGHAHEWKDQGMDT